MEPHLKQELYFHLTQAIRSKIATTLSTVCAALILFAVPLVKDSAFKLFLLTGSLAAASGALVSGNTLREAEESLNDYAATTGLNRQRSLLWLPGVQTQAKPTAGAVEATLEVPKLFDFESIGERRNDFPNVFIVGSPGSGKTTLAEYLGVVLKADKRFGVHPHAKPSDFKGFDRIFGGGRNIGTPDDEFVPWKKLESGEVVPTVAQVIMALHRLMQDRYIDYYQGKEDFEAIDVYFDEVPAIASELGKAFMKKFIPSLIMEARKIGIRLWFLTQTFRVEPLGLSGTGDLKEGATVISLGKLAINSAKTQVNNKHMEIAQLEYMRLLERPALVDEMPAKLPGYTEMQAAIDSFVNQKKTSTKKTNGRNNRNNSRRKSI
jgi:energy-coupling factor transporter ATP-binding protein EcfA2